MRNILRRRRILNMLFLLLLSSPLLSQSKTRISGSLQDSADKKPVSWATVGLYKSSNTQKPLQNIFSSSKGKFEFTSVDTGDYKVIVTYTGYLEKEVAIRIDSGKATIAMEAILLSPAPKNLGGVVVTAAARKPLLEQNDEKMIYNTEADPSVEGLTAIDVLRKTPLLAVDGDDNVQLNGQSNFKVLLNGKETAMFSKNLKEALKSFPANLIKKVEVSTNPSSKYDGEGVGGIINIITKKKVMGYNGHTGINTNTLGNYGLNASLNIKYGKWGLSGYYGMGGNKRTPDNTGYGVMESLNPVAFSKRFSNGDSHGDYFYNYGNIELSWDIDSVNTLSFYTDINGGNGATISNQRYDVVMPNLTDTVTSFLYNDQGYSYPSISFGTDYIRKFKKEEQEFTFKIYNEHSKDDAYGVGEQINPGYTRYILNDNKSTNKQLTVQADYVMPLKKQQALETGVKAIFRNAVSDYTSFVKYSPLDEYETDESNSNNFNYHQYVYSVYSAYRFKWKEISFKVGGRLEQTDVKGNFIKTSTQVKQNYFTFLPSVFISRKFKKIHSLSLTYGKRLRRPYIWDLNPFVYNIDSLNVNYGNPGLDAEITHTIEIAYSVIKGNTNINIRLGENLSDNRITRYSIFDETTGVNASTVQNAGISRITGLASSISTKLTKKWTLNLNTGLRYTFLKNRYRPEQKNEGASGYFSVNTNYQLTKKWTVSAGCNYFRNDVQLQGANRGIFFYTMGTNYKLFKDKVTLSVNASNPFTRYYKWSSEFRDNNFYRTDTRKNVQQNINFSLRWNFGKLSENVSRKRGVSNDDLKGKN